MPRTTRMFRVTKSYEIRDTLKAIGAQYDGERKAWTLTSEQHDTLWERVEASEKRSNKRDRSLFVAFQDCEIVGFNADSSGNEVAS